MKSLLVTAAFTSALFLGSSRVARAVVPIDGHLDPAYGSPLTVQTCQTAAGDNSLGVLQGANGAELDAGYAFVADGNLYLMLTGNLYLNYGGEFSSYSDDLMIFFDTGGGGQNTLRSDNPAIGPPPHTLASLAGVTFDSGFSAEYFIQYRGGGWPTGAYYSVVDYAHLPAGGPASGYFVGYGTAGGPGTLTGGTNPFGILATFDNHNVAGVTAGCGAGSGDGVTTGCELAIPLAALGNPTGCIRICAFVMDFQFAANVMNQVLGGLPAGTCNLGDPSAVNFAGIAGNQYFTVCTGVVPVRGTSWGRLKEIYH
jgi:hypothetical protein